MPANPPETGGGVELPWTVWDAEARMAREGDWRSVAYSISHDILPLIPEGSPDHAYQERARMQIKAADRLCAAITALRTSQGEAERRGMERAAVIVDEAREERLAMKAYAQSVGQRKEARDYETMALQASMDAAAIRTAMEGRP